MFYGSTRRKFTCDRKIEAGDERRNENAETEVKKILLQGMTFDRIGVKE